MLRTQGVGVAGRGVGIGVLLRHGDVLPLLGRGIKGELGDGLEVLRVGVVGDAQRVRVRAQLLSLGQARVVVILRHLQLRLLQCLDQGKVFARVIVLCGVPGGFLLEVAGDGSDRVLLGLFLVGAARLGAFELLDEVRVKIVTILGVLLWRG